MEALLATARTQVRPFCLQLYKPSTVSEAQKKNHILSNCDTDKLKQANLFVDQYFISASESLLSEGQTCILV